MHFALHQYLLKANKADASLPTPISLKSPVGPKLLADIENQSLNVLRRAQLKRTDSQKEVWAYGELYLLLPSTLYSFPSLSYISTPILFIFLGSSEVQSNAHQDCKWYTNGNSLLPHIP